MSKPEPFSAKQSVARARRENHFARGGTPSMWRGSASIFKDRREDAIENHWRQVDSAVKAREYEGLP